MNLKACRAALAVLSLHLCAGLAHATIGPPIRARIVGEIPDYVPGQSRLVTIEITTGENVDLQYLEIAGKGWMVESSTLPRAKAMSAGETLLVEVEASTLDAAEPLKLSMLVDDIPFEHPFDLSSAAVARSRGAVPGRADPDDPGPAPNDPPADADAPGTPDKVAHNVRVYGRVTTTRPDGVNIDAPSALVEIWEDDVDPNPDDYILTTTTDMNGNFDVTFYWDAVSEADPDLYFKFWYENSDVRVQDGNGNLYGYYSPTTWNYTGTSLNLGTWNPAPGMEATGFLFSHLTRGNEILGQAGGAATVWYTPQVLCEWYPTSTVWPNYSGGLIQMSNDQVWDEHTIHHEFGHHWHSSFSTLANGDFCNGICDTPTCGHCLWCNEDLGKAWNEGLADYMGELLYTQVASIYGPAPYSGPGSGLTTFENINASSGSCPAGHVPDPTINEGYVGALLHDIDDSTNDNDPSIPSGFDQLSLDWDEILRTIDLDNPNNVMEFLARLNARYNQYQSQLVPTAWNNGFQAGNTKANLAPYPLSGWAYAMVPRGTSDASGFSVPISATLNANTWFNATLTNFGGFPTTAGFANHLVVDGVPWVDMHRAESLWNGRTTSGVNLGPYAVTGGRHTAGLIVDADGTESESNEADNEFGRQWVWSPLVLPTGITVRNPPPLRTGGFGSVPAGSQILHDNCDGFRLGSNGANVQAVAIRALGATDDYDLWEFAPSTGSESGFDNPLATSGNTAGSTDFILVNYRVAAAGNRDFGVINYSGGAGGFHIERANDLSNTNLTAIGQTRVYDMLPNQIIQTGEVFTPVGGTGPTYLQVDVSPASSAVKVVWYDAATGMESRGQASAAGTTDAGGRVRLFMDTTESTWTPFAIFRDAAQGFGPVTVTIKADAAPAELTTSMAPGSFGPVVPRDNTSPQLNIGDPIVAPPVLVGDQQRTNVFVQLRNTGPRASLQYNVAWMLDGGETAVFDFGTAPANSGLLGTAVGAFEMTGGRHTQGVFIDSSNINTELDETNNRWAAQWIWAPAVLDAGSSVLRDVPPDPVGGWGDIPAGTSQYFNLDAMRTQALPTGGARYAVAAMLPLGNSDNDVYFYEASTGPQNGFGVPVASSAWGANQSDYVLANFGVTTPRALDIGVKRNQGSDAYRLQLVQSNILGAAPVAAYDTLMTATGILGLFEVELPAEPIEIRLENLSGTVNWGLTVHSPQTAFDRKSSASGVVVDVNGDGGNEAASFTAPVAGRYAIAVWKAHATDDGKFGEYRLKVLRSLLSDVADLAAVPRASAITGVRPNPFNPRTTIAFDVAVSGNLSLRVFDLLGKQVRTLEDGTFGVGHHEKVWDGLDDAGRQVASGMYFVRMNGADINDLRKMVLLK